MFAAWEEELAEGPVAHGWPEQNGDGRVRSGRHHLPSEWAMTPGINAAIPVSLSCLTSRDAHLNPARHDHVPKSRPVR